MSHVSLIKRKSRLHCKDETEVKGVAILFGFNISTGKFARLQICYQVSPYFISNVPHFATYDLYFYHTQTKKQKQSRNYLFQSERI